MTRYTAQTRRMMSLRALRRDVAILAAAATGSLCVAGWLHAEHQATDCGCDDSPEVVVVERVLEPAAVPVEADPPVVTRSPAPMRYGEHFAFIVELDQPYVVLASQVDASWVAADPQLQLEGVDTVFGDVDLEALPASIAGRLESRLAVYGYQDDGQPQRLGGAVMGTPRIVAQASGYLEGMPMDPWQLWERADSRQGLSKKEQAQLSSALWNEGQRLLIAPLKGAVRGEPAWVRSADLAEPVFYTESGETDAHHVASLEAQFAAEDEGMQAIIEYAKAGYGNLADVLRTRAWRDPQGEVGLMTSFLDTPNLGYCGDFGWAFSVAGTVRDGVLQSPRPLPTWHSENPGVVADFNEDGIPDLLMEPRILDGDTVLLQGTDTDFIVTESLPETPYFGCRC